MILVNNPGSWEHIYTPLEHAAWHGVTPTDLVFPFFLFAVGNAMAFVMPRLEMAGPSVFWKKVLKRTALIFLIGLFLNWMPFVKWQEGGLVFKQWSYVTPDGVPGGVRILGVLQRIAIAYFFASVLIYYLKDRGAFIAAAVLLLIYWLLCIAGNPADPFSIHGWFGTNIDKVVLGQGHMYHGEVINGKPLSFDPEGLPSSLGPIAQVIFGYLCGRYIVLRGKTPEMLNVLFVTGCLLLATGYVWDMSFPLNKKIWTSSYVLFTTGLAILILSVTIHVIEFRNHRGWLSKFFDVFGKNPLFIFVLSGVLPRLLGLIRIPDSTGISGEIGYTSPFGWFYEHVCVPIFSSNLKNASLLYAMCIILFYWLVGLWLDKKKIYIRV